MADNFESDVHELRTRFVEKEHGGYLFQPAYHKHIPADGVAFYMEGIWVSAFPCGFEDTLKQSD